MVLRRDAEGVWGGELALDAQTRLATLLGEPRPGATPVGPNMMFTGVHVLSPRFLDRIPPTGEQCIIRTAYSELFNEGHVDAFVTDRYWWEHSTVERYLEGIANVLDGRAELAHAPVPLNGIDEGARIHETARIREPVWIGAGASVGAEAVVGPHVQIGEGAQVAAGAKLRRCAVWAGARAEGERTGEVIA
jgi:mannose-1-phosphate guanylyltransferase